MADSSFQILAKMQSIHYSSLVPLSCVILGAKNQKQMSASECCKGRSMVPSSRPFMLSVGCVDASYFREEVVTCWVLLVCLLLSISLLLLTPGPVSRSELLPVLFWDWDEIFFLKILLTKIGKRASLLSLIIIATYYIIWIPNLLKCCSAIFLFGWWGFICHHVYTYLEFKLVYYLSTYADLRLIKASCYPLKFISMAIEQVQIFLITQLCFDASPATELGLNNPFVCHVPCDNSSLYCYWNITIQQGKPITVIIPYERESIAHCIYTSFLLVLYMVYLFDKFLLCILEIVLLFSIYFHSPICCSKNVLLLCVVLYTKFVNKCCDQVSIASNLYKGKGVLTIFSKFSFPAPKAIGSTIFLYPPYSFTTPLPGVKLDMFLFQKTTYKSTLSCINFNVEIFPPRDVFSLSTLSSFSVHFLAFNKIALLWLDLIELMPPIIQDKTNITCQNKSNRFFYEDMYLEL